MAQGAGKLKAAKTSGGRKTTGLTKKGKRACAPKRAMASKEHQTKKVSASAWAPGCGGLDGGAAVRLCGCRCSRGDGRWGDGERVRPGT